MGNRFYGIVAIFFPFQDCHGPEAMPIRSNAIRAALLLGLLWLTPASVTAQGTDPLSRALDDLRSGRIFEAVEGLRALVQNDPTSSPAYFYLSVIYTDLGELERARDFLGRALDLNPEEGKFHYQLGVILHRSDDRVGARSALERALVLGMGGEEAAAWRELGDVHVLLLEREAALEAYRKAVELEPEVARNRLALGQFYLDQNESQAALEQLRAAVELDAVLDGSWASLGVALRRIGETDTAIEALRRGIEINPADQKARYALAQSLMARGQRSEAREVMEAYRQLEDRISRANAALDAGSLQLDHGHLSEARRLFEEAVVLAPNYSAGHEKLGRVLLASGAPEDAVAALEEAVYLNPLNVEALVALGAALSAIGQFEAALEATRRSIVLDSGDPASHRQFGEILVQLGRDAEARAAFDRALTLDRGQ